MAAANGYTPLHSAAEGGHTGVVSSLLAAAHVEPNAVDNDKKTALDRCDRCCCCCKGNEPDHLPAAYFKSHRGLYLGRVDV